MQTPAGLFSIVSIVAAIATSHDDPASYRLTLGVEVNQGDADVVALLASQLDWRAGQNDFERRPDLPLQEMFATGRSVGQAEDNMDMKARLAVVADCDIADRAQNLALFRDFDLLVSASE